MAWTQYNVAMGGVPGGFMTNNNPAPIQVPGNNRRWVPAVNPYSTGREMAQYIRSEIAFRGDTRPPLTIEGAGGLWAHQAQAVGVGGQANQRDPNAHQAGPGNTIYVSCSRELSVAKGFAMGFGYVYVFRVNAGLDYNQYAGGNALQAEVMAVEGIALTDIIAVRQMTNGVISINTNFQQAGMTAQQWQAAIQALGG